MFVKENQMKYKSGQSVKQLLSIVFEKISDNPHLNIQIKPNYAVGFPNQDKQFKMDYEIIFSDFENEKWLVKGTNSIRERIYGTEFFAQNIRKIENKVTHIFVVVPDSISEDEIKKVRNYSNKIKSGTYTSFLDDVITVNQLEKLIIEKATSSIQQGMKSNILGSNAEKKLVSLLTNANNIMLWNDYETNALYIKSSSYPLFKTILVKFGFTSNDKIDRITATDEIPKLSNGGQPKTDVTVTITSESTSLTRNISVKNTNSTKVTVHEGSVIDLIKALLLNENSSLASALLAFEEYGSVKALKEKDSTYVDIIEKELPAYNEALIGFFLFGENSPLVVSPIQVADTLLYTNKFELFSSKEYKNYYLDTFKGRGQLGTPFSWTYPSKNRGKKIQIKGFTNN